MRCVLLLASGAAWETAALDVLDRTAGTVVLKRCVDLDDLLASATTEQAEYAVVAAETAGLDAPAITHLARYGVRTVVVLGGGPSEQALHRLTAIGARVVVPHDRVDTLPAVLAEQAEAPREEPTPAGVPDGPPGGGSSGRVIAVWGPVGAPGRTTVAVGLAGELARRGRACVLVDADPHAAVAQHLGVLDQVSGLLSAVRVARTGQLVERVPGLCRGVGDQLAVLTGLPRADRGVEVEPGMLVEVLDACRAWGDVVVDCGWEAGDDLGRGRPETAGLLAADVLAYADTVVAVGAADPVGLARLARALVDLPEHLGDTTGRRVHVVVNRMRSTLGWSRQEVTGMVAGFVPAASVHVLPEDRAGVDRALTAGRPVTQDGGSVLAQGVSDLLDALDPTTVAGPGTRTGRAGRWLRQRRAGTARLR